MYDFPKSHPIYSVKTELEAKVFTLSRKENKEETEWLREKKY